MSGAGAGADRDVDDDEMPGPSHSPPNQQHTREVLVTETLVYTHPDDICDWSDDTRDWPDVRGPDITYYLLHTKACDLKDVACYKSLPSFNYLQSGWVGKVMVHKAPYYAKLSMLQSVKQGLCKTSPSHTAPTRLLVPFLGAALGAVTFIRSSLL
ncbi:uncharacterized protein LOC144179516 isoform X3 [Haemaphysalis longicornis]